MGERVKSILVFGATGQVATEIRRFEGVTALSRAEADLSNPSACAAIIAQTTADAVINVAAYTAVDQAETDTEMAFRVNSKTPAAMAEVAAKRGLPFVHVSTDYVFNGSGSAPWVEDGPTGPLGVYGASKLAGEQGVQAAGGPYAILRTSWVVSSHGRNFVKTMLRLGAEHDTLDIVADQVGGPTCARDIAACLMEVASQLTVDISKTGIYHFAGGPDVSWAEFAREIFAQAGISCDVVDITSSEFPTPALRPGNSRMDCRKITNVFGVQRPDWRASLTNILTDLKAI
ncbi:dTDP-4-dehydrorhamnose reductase [Planktotalea arctica]|uniref:dTDP-4-dehydrorhamnose reductase n=1 Tax=Planktotalea arctica TaxID=1481893 RepID=UPI000A16D1D2|nr:dTDP-4-dehydrorhamnose reductase [Planktotalea arctica]